MADFVGSIAYPWWSLGMPRCPPSPGVQGQGRPPGQAPGRGRTMTEASVSFAGNLTDDPEVRYTESGIARGLGGVGGLIQQRLQGRVLQRRGGLRVVEHLLERLVHP
jgi:hypothetical protein